MTEWMVLHNSGLRADAAGFFLEHDCLIKPRNSHLCVLFLCCWGSWWTASSASSVKTPLFLKPVKWLLFNMHISVLINLVVYCHGVGLCWSSCTTAREVLKSDFRRGIGHLHLLHGLGRMRMAKKRLCGGQRKHRTAGPVLTEL